jgi:ketosteroid isomerase-like protein
MVSEEEKVRAAAQSFYDAIEDMVSGKGGARMREVWHHTSRVTSGHPTGDWAHGWEEVGATWDLFASFGKEGDGGTQVHDLRVHLYGDVAYVTAVFVAAPSWGGARLNCTNVLHRVDGVWKLVHHHADKAPSMQSAMETMTEQD